MIKFSDFCSKLNCTFTDSDRKSCLPLIKKIENYAIIASKRGLLAICDPLENEDDKFLKMALSLLTDAIESNEVAEILMSTIITDQPKGAELLKKIIVIRGIMCFVDGKNYRVDTSKPPLIKKTLYAMCMGIAVE